MTTRRRSITGIEVAPGGRLSWTAAEEACRRLLDMGVSELAGVHHPDGAVAVRRNGEVAKRPSVKVDQSEIAGSIGAGDAFYAGVLFGLHEDWPLDRCLDLGNAAAATSLHSPTTSASIRPWAECLAYAASRRACAPGPERASHEIVRRSQRLQSTRVRAFVSSTAGGTRRMTATARLREI